MNNVKTIGACLTLLLSFGASAKVNAEKAYFCPSCTSLNTAMNYAINHYAPRLKCYPADPNEIMTLDNQTCGSDTNKVVLIEPKTGNAYGFEVWQQPYGNHGGYRPNARNYQLDREMSELYSIGGKSYNELLSAMENASTASKSQNKVSYLSQSLVAKKSDGSCPTDTALATLADPNKLTDLENKLTDKIVRKDPFFQSVLDRLESNNARLNIQGAQVGVSVRGYSTNATINLGNDIKQLYVQWGFRESEIDGRAPLSDYLLYKIELIAGSDFGQPIVRATLSDMSKIDGYTIEQLKGKNGTLKITNECMLDRLDEMNGNSNRKRSINP